MQLFFQLNVINEANYSVKCCPLFRFFIFEGRLQHYFPSKSPRTPLFPKFIDANTVFPPFKIVQSAFFLFNAVTAAFSQVYAINTNVFPLKRR